VRSGIIAVLVAVPALVASREALAQEPPPPAPPAPAGVVVHIDSPRPVELQAQRHGDWVRVCTSPCDVAVRAGETVRVEGDDVPASEGFPLQPAPHATLTVDPSTKKSKAGGIVFTVVGAVGFAPGIGVTVLIVGAVISGTIFICPIATAFGARYENCEKDVAGYFVPGYSSPYVWGPAIAGAVLVPIGVVWLATSTGGHPTNVTTTASAKPPPVLALPAWQATLRGEANTALTLPPAPTMPILSGHF
jgi:hypothetical protein